MNKKAIEVFEVARHYFNGVVSATSFRKAGVAMTENTVANLEHRFQKGQSGNPAGKPKGARHKTTLLAERLMQDDVEKIVNAVLTAARNGDMMAIGSPRCGVLILLIYPGSNAGQTGSRRARQSWTRSAMAI